MLIDPVVAGHEVLLCLGSQQIPVWPEVQLLLGWRLVGDLVDGQEAVLVGPEDGGVLLVAPVDIGSVHEGRELIVLLPHRPLTHRGGADKVEAGGGEVDPGVEPVPGRDGNGEALRVAQTRLGTAIKAFCNRKICICGNIVTHRIKTKCLFVLLLPREGVEKTRYFIDILDLCNGKEQIGKFHF